jgi:hypothetical protein
MLHFFARPHFALSGRRRRLCVLTEIALSEASPIAGFCLFKLSLAINPCYNFERLLSSVRIYFSLLNYVACALGIPPRFFWISSVKDRGD